MSGGSGDFFRPELRNLRGRSIHLTGGHTGRLDIGRLTQKMPRVHGASDSRVVGRAAATRKHLDGPLGRVP